MNMYVCGLHAIIDNTYVSGGAGCTWWCWVYLMVLGVPDGAGCTWWCWMYLMVLGVPDGAGCTW